MTNGNRWRVVTQQDEGAPHVSSVILNAEEAAEHLAYDARMHELAGWTITQGVRRFEARRNGVVRVVSLLRSDAMNDVVRCCDYWPECSHVLAEIEREERS